MNRIPSIILRTVAVLVIASALMGAAALTEPAGALDGKTFVGESGRKGKEASGKDTLTFVNGRFRSTDCDQYNFGDAPYILGKSGESVTFVAVTLSRTHGQMTWRGTIRGGEVDAIYRWQQIRRFMTDVDREYWFKGKLLAE